MATFPYWQHIGYTHIIYTNLPLWDIKHLLKSQKDGFCVGPDVYEVCASQHYVLNEPIIFNPNFGTI